MNPISLKEARKRLGDLVSAVERGETVVITRRGRKVARLVAVERKGRRGLPDLADFRATIRVKGKSMSDTVIAMRAEGRY